MQHIIMNAVCYSGIDCPASCESENILTEDKVSIFEENYGERTKSFILTMIFTHKVF